MRLFAVVFAACLLATPVLAQDAVNPVYQVALSESPTPTLAVDRLQCAALDAEEASLRTAQAEDAAILALLNRARVREPAPE